MNKTQTALALALSSPSLQGAAQPDAPTLPDAVPFPYSPSTDLGRHAYVKALPVSRDYLTPEQMEELCAAASVLGYLADPIDAKALSADEKRERTNLKRGAKKTLMRFRKIQSDAQEKATVVYMNGVAINVDVAAIPYADLLADIKAITRQTHGANIRLAAKLNLAMAFDWYDIAAEEVSENSKTLKDYKGPYYAMLKECGHTNASKAFGDVRTYGRNMRAGLAPNGKTLADGSALPADKQPSGDGQSTGGANENAARSPLLRNTEELIKLYKFNVGTNSTDPVLVACQAGIVVSLKALGINPATIKTDKSK